MHGGEFVDVSSVGVRQRRSVLLHTGSFVEKAARYSQPDIWVHLELVQGGDAPSERAQRELGCSCWLRVQGHACRSHPSEKQSAADLKTITAFSLSMSCGAAVGWALLTSPSLAVWTDREARAHNALGNLEGRHPMMNARARNRTPSTSASEEASRNELLGRALGGRRFAARTRAEIQRAPR